MTTVAETKAQALIRLANKRIPKALKAVRLIGNLGKYGPSKGQRAKIMTYLRDEVESVEMALGGEKASAREFDIENEDED